MKKLLLLLLLIPIISIGQITITSNNYDVNIKLDSIEVSNFKMQLYTLNGKLLKEYEECNQYKVYIDNEPLTTNNYIFNDVTNSIGIYIIIVEYNKDILKKLIYISN